MYKATKLAQMYFVLRTATKLKCVRYVLERDIPTYVLIFRYQAETLLITGPTKLGSGFTDRVSEGSKCRYLSD